MKNKKTIKKDYKKSNQILSIVSLIAVLVNVASAMINVSFIMDRNAVSGSSDQMKIENYGINESEFNEILSDINNTLKPIYKNLSRKVIFTNDFNKVQKECHGKNYSNGSFVAGCNKQSGKELWVYYNPEETDYKETLCHEILHSVVESNKHEEELVEDLTSYEVCFEPKFNISYLDGETGEYSEIGSLFIHKYTDDPGFYMSNCGYGGLTGKYVCFGFFRAEDLSVSLLNMLCTPLSDKKYSCENGEYLVEVLR